MSVISDFFHKLLDNTWMDNNLYHVQIAHALGAAFAVLVASMFWGLWGLVGVLSVGVPVAAAKEYWYDLVYEQPNDTARGSTLDFIAYMSGAVVATALVLIKLYALKR
jgi:predicted alpha/beta hydrolase family esterase